MDDENIIKLPPKVIATVGGLVEESHVTLCIYGETLEPDELTGLLRTEPTDAFKKGHRHGLRSKPTRHGAWLLEFRGQPPKGPQELIQELLMRLPADPGVWMAINKKFTTRISVGIHMEGWNRGFSITPEILGMVAKCGLELAFDIYSYPEEEEEDS